MQALTRRYNVNILAAVIGIAISVSSFVSVVVLWDWASAIALVIPPTIGGVLLYIALRLHHKRKGFSYYGAPLILGSIILFAYSGAIMMILSSILRASVTGGVD